MKSLFKKFILVILFSIVLSGILYAYYAYRGIRVPTNFAEGFAFVSVNFVVVIMLWACGLTIRLVLLALQKMLHKNDNDSEDSSLN